MEEFKEAFWADIRQLLKTLADDVTQQLLDKLLDSGVESTEDLTHLGQEDIQPPLNLIQARKLIKFWHEKYGTKADSHEPAAESATKVSTTNEPEPSPETKELGDSVGGEQDHQGGAQNKEATGDNHPLGKPVSAEVSPSSPTSPLPGTSKTGNSASDEQELFESTSQDDQNGAKNDGMSTAYTSGTVWVTFHENVQENRVVEPPLISADASPSFPESPLPRTNNTDLTGSAALETSGSTPHGDVVPGIEEAVDNDKDGDSETAEDGKPFKAGMEQSKPKKRKPAKRDKDKECAQSFTKKAVSRLQPPISAVFHVMVPETCTDIYFCLHQPHSIPPYVKIPMERKFENKDGVFSCRAAIAWRQFGYHYIAGSEETETETNIVDYTVYRAVGKRNLKRRTLYLYDDLTQIDMTKPSNILGKAVGKTVNFFRKLAGTEKVVELPKISKEEKCDGMVSRVDWSNPEEWYQQLLDLKNCMQTWMDTEAECQQYLTSKVREKVQNLTSGNQMTKADRVRAALSLISLERTEIITSLDDTQTNYIFSELLIQSPEDIQIKQDDNQRFFSDCLRGYIQKKIQSEPCDLRWLTCLPVLRLLDADHNEAGRMPHWWDFLSGHTKSTFAENRWNVARQYIIPILRVDKPTTLAILSLMNEDQLGIILPELPPDMFLDAIIVLLVKKPLSKDLQACMLNVFDPQIQELKRTLKPVEVTWRLRSASKEYSSTFGKPRNLECKVMLGEMVYKMYQQSDSNKQIGDDLEKMTTVSILPMLKPSRWTTLPEAIENVNLVRRAGFVAERMDLQDNIKDSLNRSIPTHDPQQTISVYGDQKQRGSLHPDLLSILRQRAKSAISGTIKTSSQESVFVPRCFNETTVDLFTEIFQESWDSEQPLNHLLTWQHLEMFMKHFASLRKQAMHCFETVKYAIEDILESIAKSTITLTDMKLVLKERQKITYLIEKNNAWTHAIPNSEELRKCLKKRETQIGMVEEINEQLNLFGDRCGQAQYKDTDSLQHFAPHRILHSPMKDLCEEVDDSSTCYKTVKYQGIVPEKVVNILPKVKQVEDQKAFGQHFRQVCERKSTRAMNALSLTDFAQDVLGVALDEWEQLFKQMAEATITLQSVKDLLESMSDDHEKILKELFLMGLDKDTAETRLGQIRTFFQLMKYREVTMCIMDLKERYKKQFTGDFDVMRTLKEMDYSARLSSITGKTESITGELGELDREKLVEWLNRYNESYRLVTWLQKELNPFQELETLMDLQVFTASSPSDFEMSKVFSFLKVISIFSPLIYDLPAKAGLQELLDSMREIWATAGNDDKIPVQLIELNNELEWLQNLKLKQSGVGRDALSTVKKINARGIYTVGNLHGNTKDLDQMIVVRLPIEKTEEVEIFTYSALQDLQSTLTLVAGQNHATKQDAQQFSETLNAVRGVAETFSQLCDDGNILFGDWKSNFYCNVNEKVNTYVNFGLASGILAGRKAEGEMLDHIKQVREFMQDCLDDWAKHIQEQRKRFPVLNSFTTRQIVILRSQLSRISDTEQKEAFPNKIFPMLHTIHPGCTEKLVKRAWTDTVEEMKKLAEESPELEDEHKSEEEEIIRNLQERGLHRELILRAMKENDTKDEEALMLWCWGREDAAVEKGTVDATAIQKEETLEKMVDKIIESDKTQHKTLKDRLNYLWKKYLGTNTAKSLKDYLSVVHLGHMLTFLLKETSTTPEFKRRKLATYFHKGRPNLVICKEENVWEMVLSTYMNDKDLPLPTKDEVLLCTPQTSVEDVQLMLMRAAQDKEKIFTMVKIDQLPLKVALQVQNDMGRILQGCPDYRLVVICCKEREDKSILVPALYSNRIETTITYKIEEIKAYIKRHLQPPSSHQNERSSVNIIQSQRAGVGKTLWVRNQKAAHPEMRFVGVPLHGKTLDMSGLVNRMCEYTLPPENQQRTLYHIDIPHEMNMGVDQLLFELIILRSLSDPKGYMWARSEHDLYAIEVMPLQCWEVQSGVSEVEGRQPVHHMLELLPTIACHAPEDCLHIMKEKANKENTADDSQKDMLMDEGRFRSEPFQRVYQFLLLLKENKELQSINPGVVKGDMIHCLETLLEYSEIDNPSWAELNYFVQFLNIQWRQYEKSLFCNMKTMIEAAYSEALKEAKSTGKKIKKQDYKDPLPGLSEFSVRAVLQMSKDFVGRSLHITEEISRHAHGDSLDSKDGDREDIEKYELKRKWKASANPYVFFNPDGDTMSFIGYHVDKVTMNLLDPKTKQCLVEKVMEEELYAALEGNQVSLEEDLDSLPREKQLQKLCTVMGVNAHDPDLDYVLTSDNIKKMLAIFMRFRCQIPVIVMGESGCGKTYLVNFLCRLQKPQDPDAADIKNRFVLKIHGSVSEKEIIEKIRLAETHAKENHKRYPGLFTVVFLDEVNTTEALSLVKEILCDHTINGEHLDMDSGLRFVAACNPYKMHSKEMIKKMEEGGLGYKIPSSNDKIDRLGHIPKRHLVYRVEPMPQSLLFLVWDFGRLSDETEALYIRKIVHRHLRTVRDFTEGDKDIVTDVLHASQCYMRSRKDECSQVSLRDPERAMSVMKWFLEKENALFSKAPECPNVQTWSLIMALGVCYHAALGEARHQYRENIAKHFTGKFKLEHPDVIADLIERCQDKFVNSMRQDPTIAKNEALKENVFMMAICMELRIPLFIIGKPGSSKTLSRQILANEMKGRSSFSELFKHLKEVRMTVYQCSPLSTAEGIINMFQTCTVMQEKNDLKRFVSVVVLDEVGLAEDTPEMPLKTLHHLLEHDREGEELAEPHKKVGFLGLSNWSLDPAKNNRALIVRRITPDAKSLSETARALCRSDQKSCCQLNHILPAIAEGYYNLYREVMEGEGQREFFGLRDFYSMVKMLFAYAQKDDRKPTSEQIKQAILRNFGGLPGFNPLKFFPSILDTMDRDLGDSSITKLIGESLDRTNENRHLLLLTENQAALHIIQEHFEVLRKAVIIVGSSFPADLEFTKLCRAINRVKLSMENGETVILLNQQAIFESLYDALNQYYTYFGGVRHVDIGLGSQRMKCKVDENFRLVVVADRETVLKDFPIPLINRFEKHYLTTSTILNLAQQDIIKDLNRWIEDFKPPQGIPSTHGIKRGHQRDTRPGDIFIGYHNEAPAAITLQVCKELGQDHGDKEWKEKVMLECENRLLLAATPEAIVLVNETGLKEEADRIQEIYLRKQQHESLLDFLRTRLAACKEDEDTFIQVTTHAQLLPIDAQETLKQHLQAQAMIVPMEAFTTVQELTDRLRSFYEDKTTEKNDVLIVQCPSGNRHQDLLDCCRYIITDEHHRTATPIPMPEGPESRSRSRKHVVLVVQLPRLAGGCFRGFQMQPWECIHIDELHTEHQLPPIYSLLKGRVSSAIGDPDKQTQDGEPDDHRTPHHDSSERGDQSFQQMFESSIIPAMSILRDETEDSSLEERPDHKHANISRVDKLNNLLQGMAANERKHFLNAMRKRIYLLQCEREEKYESNPESWLSKVARNNTEMKMLTLRTHVRIYVREKMTALVAGIIAFADRNSNLDILQEEGWKKTMWFDMLKNSEAIRLSIDEDLGQSEPQEIPVKTHGAGGSRMKAKLPFSWVIYQQINECMEQERKVHSKTDAEAARAVPEILSNSPMWNILVKAASDEDVIQSYLQDFVAMVYKTQTSEKGYEHQLVQREIRRHYTEMFNEIKGSHPVPLIHAAYAQIQAQIELFSLIVQRCPEVVEEIKKQKMGESESMTLELQAVQSVMDIMQPTQEQLRKLENCQKWYETTGKIAPLINHALSTVQRDHAKQETVIKDLMNEWERIITVRMFASLVCPPGSEQEKHMIRYCPLLWLKLKKANMRSANTLREVDKSLQTIAGMQEKELNKPCPGCQEKLVEVFLLPCNHEICTTCLMQREKAKELSCLTCKEPHPESAQLQKQLSRSQKSLRSFKNSLQSFRMELVSRLCVPGPTPPEGDLIDLLLCNFTASCPEGEDADADRLMKMVLLQLLMMSQPKAVKKHLNNEFPNKLPLSAHHQELAILYVQYIEDNGRNQASPISAITRGLKQSKEDLNDTGMNVEKLEAIADSRHFLSEAANWLHKIYIQEPSSDNSSIKDFQAALQDLCSGEKLSWPRKYLLKLLVRRFSLDAALTISKTDELKWLMDSELRSSNIIQTEPDPCILYENINETARTDLARAVATGNTDLIKTWLQKQDSANVDQLLIFAVIKEIKQNGTSAVNQCLTNIVTDTEQIKQKDLLQKLLNDSLAANCEKLQLSTPLPDAKDRVLRDLLLHLYITMGDTPTISLLEPFKRLVHKPAEMKEAYLPTMPQDRDFEALQAVRATAGGAYVRMYACQNGHRYTITECGKPNQRSSCPTCGSAIGSSGRYHQLAEGNTEVSLEDQTKKGHILGAASAQPSDVVPERKLSLLQSNIIRLLLHLSMYLGANGNLEDICSLIDPVILVDHVAEFLWGHLCHDLSVLTQTMSIDDVVLLIHTIIIKMTEFTDSAADIKDPLLPTKESRGMWEDRFTSTILAPILNRQGEVLQEGHKKVMSDATLGISKLLQTAYEAEGDKEGEHTGDEDPANMAVMWRYRVNVTFQTAAQRLAELRCGDNAEQGEGAKHELLHYFMQHEPAMRDVQHLPSIIKFHKLLLQKYNHKITQKKAAETPIDRFLRLRKKAGDEECEELFEVYQQVWNLQEHRRVRREHKQTMVEELQKTTTLSRFLPASHVLNALVKIHNDLIEQLEKTRFRTCNLGPDVNLLDVRSNHLVTYDPDKALLPLVTANCSSCLLVGQGTNVKYDFDKMEYQLTERLCEGKSRIVNKDIAMVFSDSLTAVRKLEKLEAKIKQIPFTPEIAVEVSKDAGFTGDVYELVANLDTAIGFLHTVGGAKDRSLDEFMRDDLRMKTALPSRAQRHCQLQHVKALYLLMSNAREKHAAELGAVPFATLTEDGHNRFRDPLEDDQVDALQDCLAHADLEKLLMELFTCITLYIINLDDACDVDAPLIYHLAEMDEVQVAERALQLLEGVQPIRVSQCIDTWRAIYDYSEEIE